VSNTILLLCNELYKKSKYVRSITQDEKQDVTNLIKILEEALIKSNIDGVIKYKGYGLSAVQLGIHKRVGIIRIDVLKLNLINPIIIEKKTKFKFKKEGCLSIPLQKIDTLRYNEVTILNNGKREVYKGLIAVTIQHEVDHMNGLTMFNRKWK
jgi:peptide deformylase